jgi:hypothetical protein
MSLITAQNPQNPDILPISPLISPLFRSTINCGVSSDLQSFHKDAPQSNVLDWGVFLKLSFMTVATPFLS